VGETVQEHGLARTRGTHDGDELAWEGLAR
jgi:hypothetical protein